MGNEKVGGRPVVGGIEVGGMKLVGREGKRLETPRDVQPGSHGHGGHGGEEGGSAVTLVTQEAREKGGKIKRLGDKELKRMGLDPGVVEAARRELEEVADGKGWRLEVFETDGGRELRGVVDNEDEEGGGGDGEGHEGDGGYEGDGEDYEGSQEEYKDEL